MSRKKTKLVLKALSTDKFEIVKTVNTLEYGTPGEFLSRADVDSILKTHSQTIKMGTFSVDIVNNS